MTRDEEHRIADILDAAAELAQVVEVSRDTFLTDSLRFRSAERLLEIIGEAATSLSDATRARFPNVDWANITRLRIVLAHHYHRVDTEQVWIMATVDLPHLVHQLGHDRPG